MIKTSTKNEFLVGSILAGLYFIIVVSLSYLMSYLVQQFPPGLHPIKILLTIPMVFIFIIGTPAIFLINSLRPIGLNELFLSLFAGAIFILLGGLLGWLVHIFFKLVIGRR